MEALVCFHFIPSLGFRLLSTVFLPHKIFHFINKNGRTTFSREPYSSSEIGKSRFLLQFSSDLLFFSGVWLHAFYNRSRFKQYNSRPHNSIAWYFLVYCFNFSIPFIGICFHQICTNPSKSQLCRIGDFTWCRLCNHDIRDNICCFRYCFGHDQPIQIDWNTE